MYYQRLFLATHRSYFDQRYCSYQYSRFDIFIISVKNISYIVLVFLVLTWNPHMLAWEKPSQYFKAIWNLALPLLLLHPRLHSFEICSLSCMLTLFDKMWVYKVKYMYLVSSIFYLNNHEDLKNYRFKIVPIWKTKL